MDTDRIEKQVLLHAPLTRVWRAISDSTEFGSWFGMKFHGPFAPGATMRGVIVPTSVDAEVAKAQKAHEGPARSRSSSSEWKPERLFSFDGIRARWTLVSIIRPSR